MTPEEYPPLLEPGLHSMPAERLRELCVESFDQGRRRREEVFKGLIKYLNAIEGMRLAFESVWVDGSFVTEKPEPADVDIVVLMNRNAIQSLSEDDVEAAQELFHGAFVRDRKERYHVDSFLVYTDQRSQKEVYMRHFGTFRDGETKKGIALINDRGDTS